MDPNTGDKVETRKLALDRPGQAQAGEYDQYVADLVNFMTYMAEPAQASRKLWGILVLFFLAVFFVVDADAEERVLEGRPLTGARRARFRGAVRPRNAEGVKKR